MTCRHLPSTMSSQMEQKKEKASLSVHILARSLFTKRRLPSLVTFKTSLKPNYFPQTSFSHVVIFEIRFPYMNS